MIQLKTFSTISEAHVYKTILENEGIACFMEDEQMVSLDPILENALGGIKLMVNTEQYEQAKTFIQNFEHRPLTDENNIPITCPTCQSSNIYEDYKSIKSLKGIISFFLSFLFIVYPLYFKRVKKCKDCGKEF